MNPPERKPDDFDWISARAACSPIVIFEKLKLLIQTDAETRNKLRNKNTGEPYFKFIEASTNRFSVVAESIGLGIHKSVSFSLVNGEISAASADGILFKATVTLCNDGICRAQISGQEYDLWQLRKMALEELFFRDYQRDN
jgi:hypothetical protein